MNVFLVTGLYTIRLWVHLAPPYNESRYPLTIYQIEGGVGMRNRIYMPRSRKFLNYKNRT